MLRWNDRLARALGRPLGGPHQSGVKKQAEAPTLVDPDPQQEPVSSYPSQSGTPPEPLPLHRSAPERDAADAETSAELALEADASEADALEADASEVDVAARGATEAAEPFASLRSYPPPHADGL